MTLKAGLRMEDLLGGLGEEAEQEKRELEVERNPILHSMINGYDAIIHMERGSKYELSEDHIPQEYSAQDVEQFSLVLERYQTAADFGLTAGAYLSALVNHCPDMNITVLTHHLDHDIDCFGYQHKDGPLNLKVVKLFRCRRASTYQNRTWIALTNWGLKSTRSRREFN